MPIQSKYPQIPFEDRPVADWILPKIKQYGNEIALTDGTTRKSYSYKELYNLVYSIAYRLHNDGLQKGDTVALCLPNCPEFAMAYLAIVKLGGIPSGVNPVHTQYEMTDRFNDLECQFIVAHSSILQSVNNAVPQFVRKIYVVAGGGSFQPNEKLIKFEDLCNFSPFVLSRLPETKFNAKEDVALLPYSSGTTGRPKGVMINHLSVNFLVQVIGSNELFAWPKKGEVTLGVLPFFHGFGFLVMLQAITNGVRLITMAKYEPRPFLSLLQEFRVKTLAAVPPILLFMAKDQIVNQFNIQSLSTVITGGAPVGKDMLKSLIKRFPHLRCICQGYGMSEDCMASHITPRVPLTQLKYASCGLVIPCTEFKIVDINTGSECSENQTGEVWVRSPYLMVGYWKNPKATAEIIDKNGWLHTGDIGYCDKEEWLYIVDRLKELIKVRGFQVAPAELEDLLISHPEIQDAAVIGVPNDAAGEVPKGFVVLKPGSKLNEKAVQEFVSSKASYYKRLKGGVNFTSSLPKSPTGKILRRFLRAQDALKSMDSNSTASKL